MRRIMVALGTVLALGLLGWAVSGYESGKAATAAKPAAASPDVPVTAGVAEARDVPITIAAIGSVQAYNSVAIKPRIDGQIVKVDFTEGKIVKAGDPLFEIDPRPFQAVLAQATANRQKDAALLVSAEADLKRFSDLASHGFQTRQSLDQQKAQVGQLQASVAADDAQIQAAQINLDFTRITSPIDGRTGARQVDIGNIVHAADPGALVTVTQLQPIFVSLTLPQQDLDTVRQSSSEGPVAIQALAQATARPLATGTLSLIDNQVDQSTGTIHLKAQFPNPDSALWPGEFVTVNIVSRIAHDAVTVPARAVQQGPNGPFLYVIRADGTAELRTVTLLQSDATTDVLSSGLKAGERIVLDGQYGLVPDAKVAVQNPAPASPPA